MHSILICHNCYYIYDIRNKCLFELRLALLALINTICEEYMQYMLSYKCKGIEFLRDWDVLLAQK